MPRYGVTLGESVLLLLLLLYHRWYPIEQSVCPEDVMPDTEVAYTGT